MMEQSLRQVPLSVLKALKVLRVHKAQLERRALWDRRVPLVVRVELDRREVLERKVRRVLKV